MMALERRYHPQMIDVGGKSLLYTALLSIPATLLLFSCGSDAGQGGSAAATGGRSSSTGGVDAASGGSGTAAGGSAATGVGGASAGGADAGPGDSGVGNPSSGGDSAVDAGPRDAATDSARPPPTSRLRPKRYRVPDPSFAEPPCPVAGSGALESTEILLGQTHLTPEGWPLQTVSAARPLTIAVAATGTGEAPEMTATARLGDEQLTVCLAGPRSLPTNRSDLEASTYRASFPARLVQPGLEIQVSIAGNATDLDVNVLAENGLTLYLLDAQLFGEGEPEATPDERLLEFVARLPFSYLDVAQNPFGVWAPEHLLIGARDDGRTPTGESTSHGPIVVTANPHCSEEDRSAGTCTLHSGFGIMSAVLGALDTFRDANGVAGTSTWYATLAQGLGGGLAGGQRGTGDDTRLTMNHELGHAWGFPHWGSGHSDYPYEGVQRDRGGFGDQWALDQVRGFLLSPQCNGMERQSPMQRAGSCVPDGSWFDPYSDYEAARLLRMGMGVSEAVTGEVAYLGGVAGGATRAFTLPAEGGRPTIVWNQDTPGFSLARYDESTNAFVPFTPEEWNRVEEAEVPVVMFSGGLILEGESFFEEPVRYVGNVLGALDPSTPEDYAYLWDNRSGAFYWARDLNFRFELDDGTIFYRLYGSEAELRAAGDTARFAINLPEEMGERVMRLDVVSRPLGHYSEESRLSESDSAGNYFDEATVLATWER